MYYDLGQHLIFVTHNLSELDNYELSTKIVAVYDKIKQLLSYQKQKTVADFIREQKTMRPEKKRIEESVKAVSIHFNVSEIDKHISVPHNITITTKPKRTQHHIKRLTKKGFHIQTAIK